MTTQRGFSFVEVIVAIVIMGILAVGITQFIVDSASAYSVSATRNQVAASGRVVIDRIAMELHNALPESVRVSAPLNAADASNGLGAAGDQCIEFIPVVRATTYLNPRIRPAAASMAPFNVVDFVPPLQVLPFVDHYAVIYPTNASDLYKDAYGNTEAIVEVSVSDSNAGDGLHEVTPQTSHRFKRASSVDRLFLVESPVSFCVSGNKLFRYSDYGFHAAQRVPLTPGGSCTAGLNQCLPAQTPGRVLISDQVDNTTFTGGSNGQAFDFEPANRRRNAVVQLQLLFSQSGEQVLLNHEIMQQSTP
ncbi:MAG: prepilin-type N-terminal cleavage/methylation domain-containing protein [Pseudomonadota bacterium]|nr:prepilin-type N-terminal cleavage/methylation domain-containing protein [Pseudomonadota bacterium]